jgi:PRTRC genetic system ThiF family protein
MMKHKKIKTPMHFTAPYLLNPANPISVNLIGAGSTGSRVLTTLAETSHTLRALGHPGFSVQVFDDDIVCEPNLGKQRFADAELGMLKCVARVNNINRWFGTDWKAIPHQYCKANLHLFENKGLANITISCVDTVSARQGIAEILGAVKGSYLPSIYKPFYWMDYGNSRYSGQVLLATVGEISQPESNLYQPVGSLPFMTEEFEQQLQASEAEDNTPSCSHAEALEKQDLFINGALAQHGATLLLHLMRNMMTGYRGLFMNLNTFTTQGLKVG